MVTARAFRFGVVATPQGGAEQWQAPRPARGGARLHVIADARRPAATHPRRSARRGRDRRRHPRRHLGLRGAARFALVKLASLKLLLLMSALFQVSICDHCAGEVGTAEVSAGERDSRSSCRALRAAQLVAPFDTFG
jgi:hypothetical protein